MNKVLYFLITVVLLLPYNQVTAQEEVVCNSVKDLSATNLFNNSVTIQWYGLEDALGFEAISDTIGKLPQDCGTRFSTLNLEQDFYNLIPYEMNEFLVRSLCYGAESDWRWLFIRCINSTKALPFQTNLTENTITDSLGFIYSSDTNTFAYYFLDIDVGDTSVSNYIDLSYRSKVIEDTSKVSIFILSPYSSVSVDYLPSDIYQIGESFGEGDTNWQSIHFELGSNISGSIQRLFFAWENKNGENPTMPLLIDSIIVASRYCAVPDSLRANEITSSSAMISWDFAYMQENFSLEYKRSDSETWIAVPNIENNYLLYGLEDNTDYDVRVKAICQYEESLFSEILTFKTIIDLGIPENITYTITDSSALISWDLVENATNYLVSWTSENNNETWNEQSVEENQILINNLSANTNYFFRIKSTHEEITSPWSEILSLKTACSKNSTYPFEETNEISVLNYGHEYLAPQCWRIENQNILSQKFDLTNLSYGELSFVYSSPVFFYLEISTDGGETFTNFTTISPTDNPSTKIYSLSSLVYYDDVVFRLNIDSSSFYNENGIHITNFRIAEGCPLPQNISINNLETESFTLTWEDTNLVNSWSLTLKDNNDAILSSITITDSSYSFENLSAGQNYKVILRSICGENPSIDSLEIDVTTPNIEQICIVPQNFSAIWWHSDNGESLYSTWDTEEGVNVWQVVYKDYYAVAWDTALVTINPVFTLRNLEVNHIFLIKARAICNIGDTSDFTEVLSVRIGENSLSDEINKENTIEIYPNPTKDKVFIKTDNEKIDRIILVNSLGKTLKEYKEPTSTIDLSSFSKGIYYAIFYTKSNKKIVKKIIAE
ncbi:MAG: fibronectin type III domain-containing protein [Bacteroidales bacterium]|nr:fibronectin type III domain-containing protein [Bacteroidales bacterium]